MRICFLLCLFTMVLTADVLDGYLWKNRLILMFCENDYSKVFAEKNPEIKDRDIVYYHFKEKGLVTNGTKLSKAEEESIRKSYQKQGKIILIGKDGEVKKASNTLDLEKLFVLIDTMPMRKREMKENLR